jgi:O-acetyl-ADP-ribose deacetylase (regulator of RNase III)
MEVRIGNGRIELVLGNIVEQAVDAIVNAANTKLSGGGGVDGAIHRAAGKSLLAECEALPVDGTGKRCATGETRVTGAGKLPARFVIHAVGPFWNEQYADKVDAQLRDVHLSAMRAAAERGCRSIAFPAISTGAYRFPVDRAATIALTAVAEHLKKPGPIELVRFVLFSPPLLRTFERAAAALQP